MTEGGRSWAEAHAGPQPKRGAPPPIVVRKRMTLSDLGGRVTVGQLHDNYRTPWQKVECCVCGCILYVMPSPPRDPSSRPICERCWVAVLGNSPSGPPVPAPRSERRAFQRRLSGGP